MHVLDHSVDVQGGEGREDRRLVDGGPRPLGTQVAQLSSMVAQSSRLCKMAC
jgi:hypothetical protein